MRRGVLAVAALVALPAASALAQRKGPLPKPSWARATPPKGWNELPGLAKSVSLTLEQSHPFGELRGRAGAQAFADPGTGAFYLSWLVADKPATDKVEVLRSALDSVRHSRVASSPDARSTEELKYSESVKENMAEAVLEWRHISNETMSLVRAFAWVSPAGAPHLLKGECVVSTTDGKAPPAVEAACREALAAMTADVPAAERGALGDLPAGAAAPPPSDEIAPVEPGAAAPPGGQPSGAGTVGAAPPGDQKVLYAGPPAAPKGDSMNKWFVALGGLLLAAGLFLTWRARRRGTSPAAAASAGAAAAAPADTTSDSESESESDPGSESGSESESGSGSESESGSGSESGSESDPDAEAEEENKS